MEKVRILENVPTATVGAIHELVVCADLMRRGFHVFRAMSPAAPCDLIAYKPGKRLWRIEVRTTGILQGTVYIPKMSPGEFGRYDIKALVTLDGEVYYVPGDLFL